MVARSPFRTTALIFAMGVHALLTQNAFADTLRPSTLSTSLDVQATSNIFLAGLNIQPDNPVRMEGGAGTAPSEITFAPSEGSVLTVTVNYGRLGCCGIGSDSAADGVGADGYTPRGTDVSGFGNIPPIVVFGHQMFLAGMFLTDAAPTSPAPYASVYAGGDDFLLDTPLIQQVFFIGDGLSPDGQIQLHRVPKGATRLFFGFVDAFGYEGSPGWYDDNVGALNINASITAVPEPLPVQMAIVSLALLAWSLRKNQH